MSDLLPTPTTKQLPCGAQTHHRLASGGDLIINAFNDGTYDIRAKWQQDDPTALLNTAGHDPVFAEADVSASFAYPGIETSGTYEASLDGLGDEYGFPQYCNELEITGDGRNSLYYTAATGMAVLQTPEIQGIRTRLYDQATGKDVQRILREEDL